jgi:hypothetical protein
MSNASLTNTLANIKMLQDKETALYSSLGVSSDGKPLDVADQEQILNEINSLTNLRVNLISELNDQYNSLSMIVDETDNDIKDEMKSIHIMEQQLNEKKEQLNKLKNIEASKVRMANINSYYADKNEYLASVYYRVVLSLGVVCLLLVAKKLLIIVPSVVFNVLIGLIVVGNIAYVFSKVFDLSARDNMNFNQYDYSGVAPNVVSPSVYEYDMAQLGKMRDVILGQETKLQSNINNYMSADVEKTTNTSSENNNQKEAFLNMNTSFTSYDPYGENNYELNLLH